MEDLFGTLNKEPEISVTDLEVYLENTYAIAAVRPLDENVIRVLKKLSALLWQRYQISRVCSNFFFSCLFSKCLRITRCERR